MSKIGPDGAMIEHRVLPHFEQVKREFAPSTTRAGGWWTCGVATAMRRL
jgi:hypothetical protein